MADKIMTARLKELRLNKGVSQIEVARWLSVSRTSYTKYETGVYEPSIETLIKLAEFYGVTVDYIIGHSNEQVTLETCNDDEVNIITLYRRYGNKEVVRNLLSEADTLANLTEEEQALILNYRKSVKSSKRSLLDYSEFLVEHGNKK